MDEISRLIKSDDEQEEEPDCFKELDEYMSLTWEQRLYGFGITFALACILSVWSSFLLYDIVKFATVYSLGALFSLTSTMFLMGPCNQLKKMFEPTRFIATLVYLSSIVATLACAFLTKDALLVVICVVVQFIALMWYALSYIPYGREMVTGCCKRAVTSTV